MPKLPGFGRAAEWAEAQGLKLAHAGEVEAVAAAEERTFTLMVRRPGGKAAAAAEEAAEARAGITTIIRHRGGNQQVFIDNGQRWHLRAGQSIKEIPAKDPVGDQMQAAVHRVIKDWGPAKLTPAQVTAIERARAVGKYLKAHLMERMFRGQWVEKVLRKQFTHLQWNSRGVDVVDPATGIYYEILSGTPSNMELHGRRMADAFFRMITF